MNQSITTSTGIKLLNVRREFADNTGLHSTSLTINPGEFVSILGPSGCGKSTLLRCIAGLETPDTGVIRFDDQEVFNSGTRTNIRPNRRNLSMVFQDLALWPHMSVAENVEFPLTTGRKKINRPERTRRVQDALAMVGITDKALRRPSELSGGQQQRVAIARAIISNPSVLLMDEPLSALDAALRVQIRAEIISLTRELGLTVVYVTHDQSEALAMSDRIIVMESGDVRQFASPVEIYNQPADNFVANFVGTMNTGPGDITIRPEHVIADRNGSFQGTVLDVQFIGQHYEIRCDVSGAQHHWLFYSQQPFHIGDEINLAITSELSLSRLK